MIGTTSEKEEAIRKTNLVNRLVEKAFGSNHDGTWAYDHSDTNRGLIKTERLNYIVKEGIFGRPKEIVAQFYEEKNGQKLLVTKEHYSEGIFLATLYEKALPKERVDVRISHNGFPLVPVR